MFVFRGIFFVLILVRFLIAQPTFIIGFVADEVTGDPISWVNVNTVSGKNLGQANSEGNFEIEIESEKILLQFEKTGYEKQIIDLSDLDEFLDVEVFLSPKAKQFSRVKVAL